MIDNAKLRFTVYIDEFRNTAVPCCHFYDICCEVTKTRIEMRGHFEFRADETVCFFVGVVVGFVVADILALESLVLRKIARRSTMST